MSASFYNSTISINRDECVCEAWLRTQKHCRNGVGTGENALFINSIETIFTSTSCDAINAWIHLSNIHF